MRIVLGYDRSRFGAEFARWQHCCDVCCRLAALISLEIDFIVVESM